MPDAAGTPTPRRQPKPAKRDIGGRPLKPSTLMMGYGYDPVLSEGSLKAPIFLTSTFAFESAAAGKRHFEGITGLREGGAEGLVYSRFNGPNQEILEARLAVWDGADDALTFSSGMTAICILMMAYASANDVIVHSGPLYAASEGFVAKVLSRFGVTYVDFPAGATRAELDAVLAKAKAQAATRGGKVAMIYLESPANPTNALVDVEAVRDARDAALAGTPIAIDNTVPLDKDVIGKLHCLQGSLTPVFFSVLTGVRVFESKPIGRCGVEGGQLGSGQAGIEGCVLPR